MTWGHTDKANRQTGINSTAPSCIPGTKLSVVNVPSVLVYVYIRCTYLVLRQTEPELQE